MGEKNNRLSSLLRNNHSLKCCLRWKWPLEKLIITFLVQYCRPDYAFGKSTLFSGTFQLKYVDAQWLFTLDKNLRYFEAALAAGTTVLHIQQVAHVPQVALCSTQSTCSTGSTFFTQSTCSTGRTCSTCYLITCSTGLKLHFL